MFKLFNCNGNYFGITVDMFPVFFNAAYVVMPSGKKAYPKIQDNKDGTVTVRYQPTETGLHELFVKYNNDDIEGEGWIHNF